MVRRRPVYIYFLNVPSFSSRYFNKIKRTSRLGRLLALSLEILLAVSRKKLQLQKKKLTRLYIEAWSDITLLAPKGYLIRYHDQTTIWFIHWSERISTVCVSKGYLIKIPWSNDTLIYTLIWANLHCLRIRVEAQTVGTDQHIHAHM